MKKITLLLMSFIVLSSCSSSDDSDNPLIEGADGSLVFSINGEGRSSQELAVVGLFFDLSETGESLYSVAIGGGAVASDGQTWSIGVGVTFTDISEFRAGQTWTNQSTDADFEFVTGIYTENLDDENNANDIDAESFEDQQATFTITELDTGNQTFSGTFSFEATDFDTDEVITITNGRFTNVNYQTN